MRGIYIPVDQTETMLMVADTRLIEMPLHDSAFLGLRFIEHPAAILYYDMTGLKEDSPINIRATQLLWKHSRQAKAERFMVRHRSLVLGRRRGIDGFILDDVPQAYVFELFPQCNFRAEFSIGLGRWTSDDLEFVTREEAFARAVQMREERPGRRERVVPVTTPEGQRYEIGSDSIA